jgi:hypothetical protein
LTRQKQQKQNASHRIAITVQQLLIRLLERRHYGKTIFGENGIICRDETLKGDENEESYTCHRVGFCVHVRISASGCIGGCLHG